MTKRQIVRSANGGERVRFWIDAATQAVLRQLAEQHDLTVNQAARIVLQDAVVAHPALGLRPRPCVSGG